MFVTITVKAEAESQNELANTLGDTFQNLRTHFDALKKEGVFGPPEQVDVRYLVAGREWREPAQEQAHGVPDVE
jgi:hypothetical protein